MSAAASDDLAGRARSRHVVVVGGGVAGLVAALECARVGMRVTVVEASPVLGGAIRSAEVGGLLLDVGAESYATRGGRVRALIDDLGLGGDVVRPAAGAAWVAGLPGAAPLPTGGILGIPANPWAADVRRVIGWRGAWRAYLDRLRPPLTIGHERNLATLVRSRMGERVLERLVAPVVTGVYSARPDDIDVDAAAPGLNSALTRAGSLAGGVALVRGDRDPAAPGAAVEGIAGGMSRLVVALAAKLGELGVDVRNGVRADAIRREGDGWIVGVQSADDMTDAAEGDSVVHADAVVVAVDEPAARALLSAVVPGLDAAAPAAQPIVDVITLVLDAPALDAAPRGTGVLTVPGTHRAKALTHSTAKWAWLSEAARAIAPARHVVRVSFGSQGEEPATSGSSDAEAFALAVAEASALLGVAIEPGQLVGAHRERYSQSQPASAMGQAERAAAARAAVRAVPGLGVAGAWISGTGLAQVVPGAVEEAEHVRRGLLWGDDALA